MKLMKNKFFVMVFLLTFVGVNFSIFGSICKAEAEYTIQYAHGAPEGMWGSIEETFGIVFKNVLEAETEGNVRVEVYSGGALGDFEAVVHGVQMGAIEMAHVNPGALSGLDYRIMAYEIPFAFDCVTKVIELSQADFMKDFEKEFAQKTGIKILDMTTYGFRSPTHRNKFIRTPEDINNVNIRVTSPLYTAAWEAVGAQPTPIAIGELYSALEAGVIDAQENPPGVIQMHGLYEVQGYYTLLEYVAGVGVMIMNNDFYESLPTKYQEAIDRAKEQARIAGLGYAVGANIGVALDYMMEKGLKVYIPTEEEKQAFKELMQPAAIEFLARDVEEEFLNKVLDYMQ